jgi:hypothetical protein
MDQVSAFSFSFSYFHPRPLKEEMGTNDNWGANGVATTFTGHLICLGLDKRIRNAGGEGAKADNRRPYCARRYGG